MEHLKGFLDLGNLSLANTRVEDAGLVHIDPMKHLGKLDLDGTGVSDAGLAHLAALTRLHWLHISRTRISDDGYRKLREALPKTDIFRDHFSAHQDHAFPEPRSGRSKR